MTNGATKVPGVPKARTGLYRNATLCVDAVIVSFVRRCPMWPVYGVTTLLIIIIIINDITYYYYYYYYTAADSGCGASCGSEQITFPYSLCWPGRLDRG